MSLKGTLLLQKRKQKNSRSNLFTVEDLPDVCEAVQCDKKAEVKVEKMTKNFKVS